VNTYTTNVQVYADVATTSAGDFVVTWHSFGGPGTDTSGSSIMARRFDAGGNPLAAEFQVNTYTSRDYVRDPLRVHGTSLGDRNIPALPPHLGPLRERHGGAGLEGGSRASHVLRGSRRFDELRRVA
jgi:hypothetical protein